MRFSSQLIAVAEKIANIWLLDLKKLNVLASSGIGSMLTCFY